MLKDGYYRRARLKSVVTGDTVRLLIDLGFKTYSEHSIRLSGLTAPKFNQPNSDVREAAIVRNYVGDWFRKHYRSCSESVFEPWPYVLHSERADGFDKYLGKVYCLASHCLNDDLLQSGYVKPYGGK